MPNHEAEAAVGLGEAEFDGCVVAAYIEPDGDVIKLYRALANGAVLLQPANPRYPSLLLEPGGEREARIWGRIVLQQREL